MKNRVIIFLGKVVRTVLKEVFIYSPVTIIGFLGLSEGYQIIFEDKIFDEIKLLTIIGIVAASSSLCFSASQSGGNKKKKRIYYKTGERLMYSSLILSILLGLFATMKALSLPFIIELVISAVSMGLLYNAMENLVVSMTQIYVLLDDKFRA